MDPIEAPPSDSSSVVATLRQLIVNGRLAAGERLAEIPVAESLGVSRTPVRLAFRSLEQEGLLAKAGKRGYVVRSFSEADVRAAVEVRGTLEGLAARHLAERGMSAEVRATLAACITEGATVLAKGHLVEEDVGRWSRLNKRFHDALVDAHESRVIADAIARNNHLPFASADSIALDRAALPGEYQKLRIAQLQHQLVFDALDRRESARVEMLMREHAWVGFRYGQMLGLETGPIAGLPG
ncbi:GntR family transcriptional regulator [Variovorax sp. YR752]|uniref:GntR family transcriptional regulator n=1 Tax=Variovorax sp. YR752 TaxID=1884383 RepID=UPI0031382724